MKYIPKPRPRSFRRLIDSQKSTAVDNFNINRQIKAIGLYLRVERSALSPVIINHSSSESGFSYVGFVLWKKTVILMLLR